MEEKGQKLEQMGELVRPSLAYKDSFIEAVREFQAEGSHIYLHSEMDLTALEEGFEDFLAKIKEREEGTNLPEGRVPQTELWLVEDGKFIGWTKIRHKLNDALLEYGGHIGYAIRPSDRNKGYGTRILELALPFARSLGVQNVLLTCDDDNTGSVKIIEKSGGVLENTSRSPEGKLKRRYWIKNNL